jgi:cytochrome b6-f complex iron-sulfur subunit
MPSDDPERPRRRDLLGIAIGGSAAALGAALGAPVARFLAPPSEAAEGRTVVGKLEDFGVGAAKTVLVRERPVIVLRTASGEVRAFSALCTHLRCVVAYVPERDRIECPCHGGVFASDGRNLAGPPLRPLEELRVVVEEGAVIVSLA